MVGKYKAYPEYKDSGVGWLGNIPKHWETNKTKWYCKVTDGSHHSPDIQLEGYPFISVTDVGENKIDFCNAKKISKSDYYRLVREGCKPSVGDILLTKDGTIGRACLVNVSMPDFVILSSLGLLTPKQQVLNKFLYYYLISGINIDQMNSMIHGSALRRMTINKINELLFICPEISEQQNIANFLDYETSKIDMLIEKQQQLIKLLEEKRQAVISHAVTKGLNPNVPMKKSEIDWVKNIPYHWGKTPMRWSTKIFSGGTPSKNKEEYWENGTIPWLNSGSVNQKKITTPSAYITKKGYLCSSAKWIPRNSLVIALAGQGKTKGMVAIVDIDTTCNQSMGAIIPDKNKFITTYLYYWLLINYQNIRNLSGGDLRDGLNLELIADIECPMPPLEEQEKISFFIEKEIFIINQLNDKTNQVIDLLKERRTTLISAAVTGKIDVRDWQAPTVTD